MASYAYASGDASQCEKSAARYEGVVDFSWVPMFAQPFFAASTAPAVPPQAERTAFASFVTHAHWRQGAYGHDARTFDWTSAATSPKPCSTGCATTAFSSAVSAPTACRRQAALAVAQPDLPGMARRIARFAQDFDLRLVQLSRDERQRK